MIASDMESFERAGVSQHYDIAANSSVFMARTISRHSGKVTCIDGENRMKASEPELFSKNLLARGIMMHEAMAVSTMRKEGKRHTAGPQRRGNSGNEAALARGSAEHTCEIMSMAMDERLRLVEDDAFWTKGPAKQW